MTNMHTISLTTSEIYNKAKGPMIWEGYDMITSKKTHIFTYRQPISPSKQKPNNNNLNPVELLIKANKHNTKPCVYLIHTKKDYKQHQNIIKQTIMAQY